MPILRAIRRVVTRWVISCRKGSRRLIPCRRRPKVMVNEQEPTVRLPETKKVMDAEEGPSSVLQEEETQKSSHFEEGVLVEEKLEEKEEENVKEVEEKEDEKEEGKEEEKVEDKLESLPRLPETWKTQGMYGGLEDEESSDSENEVEDKVVDGQMESARITLPESEKTQATDEEGKKGPSSALQEKETPKSSHSEDGVRKDEEDKVDFDMESIENMLEKIKDYLSSDAHPSSMPEGKPFVARREDARGSTNVQERIPGPRNPRPILVKEKPTRKKHRKVRRVRFAPEAGDQAPQRALKPDSEAPRKDAAVQTLLSDLETSAPSKLEAAARKDATTQTLASDMGPPRHFLVYLKDEDSEDEPNLSTRNKREILDLVRALMDRLDQTRQRTSDLYKIDFYYY